MSIFEGAANVAVEATLIGDVGLLATAAAAEATGVYEGGVGGGLGSVADIAVEAALISDVGLLTTAAAVEAAGGGVYGGGLGGAADLATEVVLIQDVGLLTTAAAVEAASVGPVGAAEVAVAVEDGPIAVPAPFAII